MRKIEIQLQTAITNGREFRSANTTVDNTDHGQIVRLHGNKIAQIDNGWLTITSAGWETTTTKSRLNAVLDVLVPGARIFAKAHTWFISYNGKTAEFSGVDGISFPFNVV